MLIRDWLQQSTYFWNDVSERDWFEQQLEAAFLESR